MARIVCSVAGAVAVVSCFLVSARAEEPLPPDIAFAQSYCNVSWESAITVIPTTEGMTIAVNGARQEGSSESFTFVNYLAEALPDGTPVNQYPFAEGFYPQKGCAVAGGYVFAGSMVDQYNNVLVGVSPQGVEQWRQSYDNPSTDDYFDHISKLVVQRDGNLLALGQTSNGGPVCEYQVLVQKTDALGNLIWAKTHLQGGAVGSFDLVETPEAAGSPSGCYVLARDIDPVLLRLDDNGDVVREIVLSSPDWRYDFRSLAVTPDGIVLAGARLGLPDSHNWDACLAKVDFDGAIVWQRAYDYQSSHNEIAVNILGLPDGGFVLYCLRSGFTFALVRTNAQGEVLWEHGYTVLDGMGYPCSIALAYDGGVLMAYTRSIGSPVTDSDALVVKTTPIIPPIAIQFRRGDTNSDGAIDLSDAVNTLCTLFLGTGSITCQDAADSNDDGAVDLSDAVCVLTCLFLGSPRALMPPYPGMGIDPTDDGLDCAQYGR